MLSASAFAGLLGQEDGLDVGEDTALGDGHSLEELVQLFVVADGQLEMARVDSGLFVVASGIASQLQHFCGQVFHHGSQVHGGTGSDSLGVVAFAEMSVDSADWELQSSPVGSALGLSLGFASLSTS